MKYIKAFFILLLPSVLVLAEDKPHWPSLTASFQTVIRNPAENSSQQAETWAFMRDTDKVEIRQSHLGEIWQRHDNGELDYAWLHHVEKMIVTYNTTDLKVLERQRQWDQISTLFDPTLLVSLPVTATGRFADYPVNEYHLDIGGRKLILHWITELSLPAYIEQETDEGVMQIKLRDVVVQQPGEPVFTDTDQYRDLDFADLGDNEAHPIARFLLHPKLDLAHSHH